MKYLIFRLPLALLLIAGTVVAQQTPADDVVRTNVELVQTAITVVNKNGKFVEGLDRADFELIIDGKSRPISFLERVVAASERELQLAARKQRDISAPAPPAPAASVRGRTIIFHIDDLHLSFSSRS